MYLLEMETRNVAMNRLALAFVLYVRFWKTEITCPRKKEMGTIRSFKI